MILVGTCHADLDGPKRLEYLLRKFSPKKITLEMPEGIDIKMFNRIREITRKKLLFITPIIRGSPNLLKLFLEYNENGGYEFFVTQKYVKENGAELSLVDSPMLIKENFPSLKERIFGKAVLPQLLSTLKYKKSFSQSQYPDLRDRIVKKMDEIFYSLPSPEEKILIDLSFMMSDMVRERTIKKNEREKFMADKILELNPEMHIGGLMHAFSDYAETSVKNLYERLIEFGLNIERIKLNEAFDY